MGEVKTWRLLFVCTGNTCRSPMAEAITRGVARRHGLDLVVTSAGIDAHEGSPATPQAVTVMGERYGQDLSGHRARRLFPDEVERADLIFTMTDYQLNEIIQRYPETAGKVHVLKEFAQCGTKSNSGIPDPFGQALNVYQECAAEIEKAVERIVERLARG